MAAPIVAPPRSQRPKHRNAAPVAARDGPPDPSVGRGAARWCNNLFISALMATE